MMRHFSKMIILVLVFSFLIFDSQVMAATADEFAVALNLSGRQRMLSQKMTKEYLMVANGIDVDNNKKSCLGTIKLFDASLNQLINGDEDFDVPTPPNDDIKTQLGTVKGLWTEFKGIIEPACTTGDKTADVLSKIAEKNVPLLKNMHKAVGMYEAASSSAGLKSGGKVINVAGRQRMLSQRMTKEVLLITIKQDLEGNVEKLQSSRDLFDASLNNLINGNDDEGISAPANDNIKNQLLVVKKLWTPFKVAIDKVIADKKADADGLNTISTTNVPLLKEMNKAVSMYEAASS